MTEFTRFWLDTAAIQANAQDVFPYDAEVERDRDEAASLNEPCARCHAVPGTVKVALSFTIARTPK